MSRKVFTCFIVIFFFHKKESLSVDALNFFQKLRLGFNNILTHEEEPNIPQDLPMQ